MYFNRSEIQEILSRKDGDSSRNPFDGSDYDRGQLEALEASIELQAECLVRLFRTLIRKGVISNKEAVSCIFKYGSLYEDEDEDDGSEDVNANG